jgi:hypothetical protein
MTQICQLVFLVLSLALSSCQLVSAKEDLDPERLLKQLAPEIKEIKITTPEELEPNPKRAYRRHAFIREDFNGDGTEDIAICGTDAWVKQGRSSQRNGYVLVASKNPSGSWTRVFFHKFTGLASPFLIWDQSRMALLVGGNDTDFNPGDIVWDRLKKGYKLVSPNQK